MSNIDEEFWNIFQRVLDVEVSDSTYFSSKDTEEWDSLKHVELVFELEASFNIDISPDDIVSLFSDTTTVLNYVRRKTAE